jgi:hypothetical protein
MRYIAFLALFVCGTVFAQSPNIDYKNDWGVFYKVATGPAAVSAIQGRTLTTSSSDTTRPVPCVDYTTFYVALQVADTATILVYYSVSVDDSTYTPYTLIDSLSVQAATGGFKSINMTTTLGGMKSVKFRFDGSGKAFALGNTPTYKATYVRKKY